MAPVKIKKYVFVFLILLLSTQTVSALTYGIQTKTSNCVTSTLPDPACSPGAVLTTDTKVICVVGYTKTVRDVSDSLKKKVFKEYGILWSKHSNYEVDHIISLELGGSNDISNLFPESFLVNNGARIKDKFENYLHKQVCDGKITLKEAQKEISTNWLYYDQLRLGLKPAITSPVIAPVATTTTQTKIPSFVSSLPLAKKSSSGLCHAQGTRYYDQTTKYISYSSIKACIASGGRLPQ